MIERHPVAPGQLHPLRATDLTCSDLGAAAGVDPYKTRLQLYAEKTGRLLPSRSDTMLMWRGRILEPAVIAAYSDSHPFHVVRKCGIYLRDPDIRLGGTPDAVALTEDDDIVNIQCKVVAKPMFERWKGGVPTSYVLQTMAEGMLMDVSASVIACLVLDTYTAELFEFPVARHADAEARVRRMAVEWADTIASGRMPAPDLARDAETVVNLYPTPVPEKVADLSSDNLLRSHLFERAERKLIVAEHSARIAEIDTDIKAKMGDAEIAQLPGWKITWKEQDRKPTPASTFRVLRVNREKEEAA